MRSHHILFVCTTLSLAIGAMPALALTPSCQAEMEKITTSRQSAVDRVNGFSKKRPTATQACAAFNTLVAADKKLLDWMTSNKDWCQVPDQLIEQVQEAREQANKVRDQACSAAKKEAQMRRNAPPAAGPPPGGGVKLPQGAL